MNLSRRDNFARMMNRRNPQWLPMTLPVTPPIAQRLREKLGTDDLVAALNLDLAFVGAHYPVEPDAWRDAYAALGVTLPDTATITIFGIAHDHPDRATLGDAWHLQEMLHPLATVTDVAQLEALPFPDVNDPRWYAHMAEATAKLRDDDRVVCWSAACSTFEHSWYLRGMDNLMFDLIEDGPVSNWLLDYFTDRTCAAVRAACEAGVDMIQLGDDIAMQTGLMMAPDFWRKHLQPRLARITRTIRDAADDRVLIAYHTDGDVRKLIDDLIDVGIDVLNPMQPECMPLAEVIPQYQDRLRYWGMIGTQTTMPFGSTDDVHAAVAQCADWARGGAAILMAPTHVLEPDVPMANIDALLAARDACRLAGRTIGSTP